MLRLPLREYQSVPGCGSILSLAKQGIEWYLAPPRGFEPRTNRLHLMDYLITMPFGLGGGRLKV